MFLCNICAHALILTFSQDRYEITWPKNQLDLISKLSSVSKSLIVVQIGSMVDSSSLVSNHNVHSLVWAGYPGQDGGTAIFNVLTGKVAPAGRLPVTQYPVRIGRPPLRENG